MRIVNKEYDIKRDGQGFQICRFRFEWTDEDGIEHLADTDDLSTAETIIGLLTGEICLADLEP